MELFDFVQQYQDVNIFDKSFFDIPNHKEDDYILSQTSHKSNNKLINIKVAIKPTKCILFENGNLEVKWKIKIIY